MLKAVCKFNRRQYSTEGRGWDDEWSRGSSSTEWEFKNLFVVNDQKYYEISLPIYEKYINKDETIYGVIAVWSTGDSFGSDGGAEAELFYLSNVSKDCFKVCDILKNTTKIKDSIIQDTIELGNGYKLNSYIPWNGYFESLDYVCIVKSTKDEYEDYNLGEPVGKEYW